MALEIHAKHVDREFDLFDEDSQMVAYLEHRQNAYINPEKVRCAYPEQIVRSHSVEVIQMVHDKTDCNFK